MMNRELLDHLRALNAVAVELRNRNLEPAQREVGMRRVEELRAKLPTALLIHHDRMIAAGRESVAAVSGSSCGGCHLKLPVGILADLHQPGRIGVCPHCGVFLFGAAADPERARA